MPPVPGPCMARESPLHRTVACATGIPHPTKLELNHHQEGRVVGYYGAVQPILYSMSSTTIKKIAALAQARAVLFYCKLFV